MAVVFLASAARSALATGDLSWRRRSLRHAAPQGYLGVVSLAREGNGVARAALVCETEGVELRAEAGRWTAVTQGGVAARGVTEGEAPRSFFVKRSPQALMLGVNGRWVYSRQAGKVGSAASVRVGVSSALEVKSFRLVAREPVRFADDFPDPEPTTERWAPVRGRWVLSSLSFPEQSANPAELAAVFDEPDDAASRGRTREQYVGIGVRLGGRAHPQVVRLAGDSPAERAGIRQGDRILAVDGAEVRSIAEGMELLQGEVGESVRVHFQRGGEIHEVELTRQLVVWGRTRRHVPILPSREDRVALITTGYDFWTDYRFVCAARTHGIGAFGLVFAYLGPQDYHVFRWLSAGKVEAGFGRWQVERVRGGRRQVLAKREGGFLPHDFYGMSVALEGDKVGEVKATCALDGVRVLEAFDDAIVPGRVGLWAEAPGAVCFDDVVVGRADREAKSLGSGTQTEAQRRDRIMRYWADPIFSWQYAGLGQQWWHKANFPGDVVVRAALSDGDSLGHLGDGPLRLTICAAGRQAGAGYCFEVAAGRKQATLRRAGEVVKEQALADGLPKEIALAREGRRVAVRFEGKPWLGFEDEEPLRGSLVGVAGLLVKDVQVHSPNLVEYYFNSSPTEWHVMRGHWEVMNRWVCDPRWSWFGGRSEQLAAIWSKRRLDGDCYLDVHLGAMMMARYGSYENMRDIGLTICGDGRSLASGYTLIVGAENNTRTLLLRNGKLVCWTRGRMALLPTRRMGSREVYSQHRGWLHLQLVKEGRTVRFYFWNHLALTYEDPDPLPGGHAAIWSVDNGVLVAKARLAASRLGEPTPEPFLRRYRRFADRALTNDCCDGQVRIERKDSIYEITNAAGGGPFAVALRPRVFSAFDRPRLSFEVKLTPEAKVDLYLRCRGTLHRVLLSGPPDDQWVARTLGRFEGAAADGQWHRVSFDLLGALRQVYPSDELLVVWGPMLANFSNQHYLMAGIGGNGAGATYWLRNVSLAPSDELVHLSPTRSSD